MITFSVEDLKTPEKLERVLRQFERAIPTKQAAPAPDLAKLAAILGPQIRDSLQGTGQFPINLQSLLPGGAGTGGGAGGGALVGTHSERLTSFPAINLAVGTVFYETDRTVFYAVVNVGDTPTWQCVAGGYMKGTLSPDQKPTDLGGQDSRFEFFSTDFSKFYIWTGTDWEKRADQLQKGFIQVCAIGPAAAFPGWQLCNGSTVLSSRDDGTTEMVTVPDYSAGPYLKVGSFAAVGPFPGSGLTGDSNNAVSVHDGGGAGVAVAAQPHQHDSGNLELPNTLLRAYYRL